MLFLMKLPLLHFQLFCVTAREILGRLCHGGPAAPKKHPPAPPPNPKSCFPGNSLQAWLPRADFFETWQQTKVTSLV